MDGQNLRDNQTRTNYILDQYPLRLAESYVRSGKPIDQSQPFCTIDVSMHGIEMQQGGTKMDLAITSRWDSVPGSNNQTKELFARIHTGKGPDMFIIKDLFNSPVTEKIGDPPVIAIETDSNGQGQPFSIRKTIVAPKSDNLQVPPLELIYNRANPDSAPQFLGQTEAVISPPNSAQTPLNPNTFRESIKDKSGKEIVQIYETLQVVPGNPSVSRREVFIKQTK